jgi:hypothetical protein
MFRDAKRGAEGGGIRTVIFVGNDNIIYNKKYFWEVSGFPSSSVR